MPSEPQLAELHEKMLTLLKNFHMVCVENGVNYSLHGGTLLGAIRDKGFIPWDDDVDVSMTREEYEKFMAASRNMALPDNTEFRVVERWPMFVQKFSDGSCLSVDIFIYDGISEHRLLQKCKYIGIMFFDGMLKTKELIKATRISNKYGRFKYSLFYLAYLIGKLFPTDRKYRWFDHFSKKWFCGNSACIHRSNDQYYGISMILPKDDMSSYKLVSFEDTCFLVTENAHDVLTQIYGQDYMIPKKFSEARTVVHELLKEYNADNNG